MSEQVAAPDGKLRVTIVFDNAIAGDEFVGWLKGRGQEFYWDYMRQREGLEKGPVTAVHFEPWLQLPEGYRVIATCGRLEDDE